MVCERVISFGIWVFTEPPVGRFKLLFFLPYIPVLGHFSNQWRQFGEVGSGIQQAIRHMCILDGETGALMNHLGVLLP